MHLFGVFGQLHPQSQEADSDIELFEIQVIYFHVCLSSYRKNEISSEQFLLPAHLAAAEIQNM